MNNTPSPRFIQHAVADAAAQRAALETSLLAAKASVAPKFFYDPAGSQLFEAITELPEYYLTRTEAAIFEAHGADMARHIGIGGSLIDLGAGNCAKAARLFTLLAPQRYVAVDISIEFVRAALQQVQREHPHIEMVGLGTDFSSALDIPTELTTPRPVFFYPGSSIGNFTPDEALGFLTRVRAKAKGGGLLIGIDLLKAAALLEPAYDDALGITAAFNRNLLLHLNRVLGSNFDPADWRHVAFFNRTQSRIEMHLEARRELHVTWPGSQRHFARGERLHTENSCKYTPGDFAALLRDAGFAPREHWLDDRGWFAVFWAEA